MNGTGRENKNSRTRSIKRMAKEQLKKEDELRENMFGLVMY
jgi:hypothetical protein